MWNLIYLDIVLCPDGILPFINTRDDKICSDSVTPAESQGVVALSQCRPSEIKLSVLFPLRFHGFKKEWAGVSGFDTEVSPFISSTFSVLIQKSKATLV